jgi:hypothetical protein
MNALLLIGQMVPVALQIMQQVADLTAALQQAEGRDLTPAELAPFLARMEVADDAWAKALADARRTAAEFPTTAN